MNTSRINLEQFEGDGARMLTESLDYQRGKADGIVHAEALKSAKIAQSIGEVSSVLNDMTFGYEEARHHILEQMQPLVRQISDKILPEIAKAVFGAHLIEVIDFELQKSASLPVQIGVAPDILQELEDLKNYDRCVFVSDSNLTDNQAVIQQNDVEVLLDIPALILALQTTLNGLESPKRSISDGQ